MPYRISVDTGGTFTDVVALVDGDVRRCKVRSTPRDPAAAVLAGLRRLIGGAPVVLHYGSTVATNALLERRGAPVALVTTAGFEDVIEIGRQTRPRLYDLTPHPVPALVPPRRRIGVVERVASDGFRVLAIAANGGVMPAARGALQTAGLDVRSGEFANSDLVENADVAFLGDVFAIPGRIDSLASEGCNDLIRDGAMLVRSVDDILESLGPLVKPTKDGDGAEVHSPRELTLNDQEREILRYVTIDPRHIDEVLRDSQLEPSRVLSTPR